MNKGETAMPKRCTSEDDYRRVIEESGQAAVFLFKHSAV
jgi:hypothetical protein